MFLSWIDGSTPMSHRLLSKSPVTEYDTSLWVGLGVPSEPPKKQSIVIILESPLDGKTLLLKTAYTVAAGHKNIQLKLREKFLLASFHSSGNCYGDYNERLSVNIWPIYRLCVQQCYNCPGNMRTGIIWVTSLLQIVSASLSLSLPHYFTGFEA